MKLLFPDSVILRIPIACVCFFLPALSERMYRLFRLRMRIVCIPKLDNNAYPFKIRLRNLGSEDEYINRLIDKYQGLGKATSSDWAFNALVCELLSNEGKAIGIMTNGSTWNSIDTPMRKQFVEEGLIECVIALPPKIFEFTAISTSLVVFSKGNKSVRIVDASKLCQQGRRYNEFSGATVRCREYSRWEADTVRSSQPPLSSLGAETVR